MSIYNKKNKYLRELEIAENHLIHSKVFSKSQDIFKINFNPETIFKFLILVIFCLVFLSTLGQLYYYLVSRENFRQLIKLFFLDAEQNIPALYSSLALLFCSVLLIVIAKRKYQKQDKYHRYWQFLSLIFFYMGIDENVSIHELSTGVMRRLFNSSGFLHYAWVIPGIILFSLFALVYLKFVLSLPPKTKFLFVFAAVIFVSGAIGIEMIGGYFEVLEGGRKNLTYVMIATLEETFEMFGIAIFIYALLKYIQQYVEPLKISW